MPSIVELGMSNLDGLREAALARFENLNRVSELLREEFLRRGYIHSVSPEYDKTKLVTTVDGAVIVDQLFSGDFIHSCSVAGEGNTSRKLFANEGPADYFSRFVEHDSANSSDASALMALQEILLFSNSEIKHDIQIIDGAWFPGFISVMMTIFRSKTGGDLLAEYILRNHPDADLDFLMRGFNRRLNPWDFDVSQDGFLVAISKSDSANLWSPKINSILKENQITDFKDTIYDRTLANMILKAGEFLSPVSIAYDRNSQWNIRKDEEDVPGLAALASKDIPTPARRLLRNFYRALTTDGHNPSRTDVGQSLKKIDDEEWLWSTYFKPTAHGDFGRPLRIDFPREKVLGWEALDNKGKSRLQAEYLNNFLPSINNDIVADIQEPLSQYYADLRAKDISVIAKLAKQHLLEATPNDVKSKINILKGYRT